MSASKPVQERSACHAIRGCALAFLVAASTGAGLLGQEVQISSTIGELTGSDEQIFGQVKDAVFLPEGRVAVLDSRMFELRLYTTEGRHLQSLGRSGRGPGEFYVPEAVARTADGVVVLDRGNARLTRYRQVTPDSFAVSGEIPLPFHAWDLCVTAGRIYLSSDQADQPVVEIAPNGDVVRTFGAPPRAPEMPANTPARLVEMLKHRARIGVLDCSAEGVTWASSITGGLQHFDLDGDLQFEIQLEDFDAEAPALTENRAVSHGPREGISHIDRIMTIHHRGKAAVIQVSRVDYAAREITWSNLAFDLVSRRSEAILVGLDGPLHDAGSDGTLLFSREEPFPQLFIGRARGSGEAQHH